MTSRTAATTQRRPVDGDRRQADLGRELRAVIPQAGQVEAEAHRPRARRGVVAARWTWCIARKRAGSRISIGRPTSSSRDQPNSRSRLCVDVDDLPRLVGDDHRVGHGVEEREIHGAHVVSPIAPT